MRVVFDNIYVSALAIPEDVDVVIGFDQVGDPVVPKQQDANVLVRMGGITIAHFGKLPEDFCALIDGKNGPDSRSWIVLAM